MNIHTLVKAKTKEWGRNFVSRKTWPFWWAGLAAAGQFFFRSRPDLAELIYARHIYPAVTFGISWIARWLPFSLTELCIATLIIGFVYIVAAAIRRKMPVRRASYIVLAALAILYGWFNFSWGFNYLREPLMVRLDVHQQKPDSLFFRASLLALIDQTNTNFHSVEKADQPQIDAELERAYGAARRELDLPEMAVTGRAPKYLFLNIFLNRTLTSGFFSPFFHEIHINRDLLPVEFPFTLAHEKAHQMGFAAEAEASFAGYLLCMKSKDPFIRYSARFNLLGRYLQRAQFIFSDYETIIEKIDPNVLNDFQQLSQRIAAHRGLISDVSGIAYEHYLRANNIKDGLRNYNGVVDIMLRWEMKKQVID